MGICAVCGNDYDKSFDVIIGEERSTYDCFECAIHNLAPHCTHCNCVIIGHGVESEGTMFCCRHCAQQQGVMDIRDRSEQAITVGTSG